MARIRIIGGEWRSRLIPVVDGPGLRPTPDRVRETLFNWLGQDLSGLACLDLFAGSGILGFEAASRGAAAVTLVERDQHIFQILRQNCAAFDTKRLEPIRSDALKFAASAPEQGRRYDLLFLDPPYGQGWLELVWPLLPGITGPGARAYAEAEALVTAPAPWRVVKEGRAGQVFYHLLEHA
jgi:16S rRNA (guanine966-N2)-methyltransferase